jgi:hypothetical protein
MQTARAIPAMRTMEKRLRGDDKQQKKWRRERLWKSRGVEKSKNDFPTPLGNPANPAGFPLSHSLGDYGRFTKIRTFHLLRKGATSNVVRRGTFLLSVDNSVREPCVARLPGVK